MKSTLFISELNSPLPPICNRWFGRNEQNIIVCCLAGKPQVTSLRQTGGFWDPEFIDEKYARYSTNPNFITDGMGPNLERFGGKPYRYIPRKLVCCFPLKITKYLVVWKLL